MNPRMLASPRDELGFVHEAMLYEGDDGFVAQAMPFVLDGVAASEPVLVAVAGSRLTALRDALGDALGESVTGVEFADMAELGRNPARIIPRWRGFVTAHPGAPALRGIGEPIWAARGSDELVECQQHEALLNLAFADAAAFRLLCPYDAGALPNGVLEEAYRSHPYVTRDGVTQPSESFAAARTWFDGPLPDPPADAIGMAVEADSLADTRRFVATKANAWGLSDRRTEDLVLAVGELATNTVRHGGGRGNMRMWRSDGMLVCEVRDGGRLSEPLAGRVAPIGAQDGGVGLWLVNQLCDLVQIRSLPDGTLVRVHMSLD